MSSAPRATSLPKSTPSNELGNSTSTCWHGGRSSGSVSGSNNGIQPKSAQCGQTVRIYDHHCEVEMLTWLGNACSPSPSSGNWGAAMSRACIACARFVLGPFEPNESETYTPQDKNSLNSVASGSGDGIIKVWDLTARDDEAWRTAAQ